MRLIPSQLEHLVSKSVLNYLQAPPEVQRLVRITKTIQGRYGDTYVFQLSHGVQQIKRYEPHKYRNNRNTPLRQRTRTIVRLAGENPDPSLEERLRFLFRTYPYYLLQSEAVNLRMKNFYFTGIVWEGDNFTIYRTLNPEHPNPAIDEFYTEEQYKAKRTISFNFDDREEEYYYAQNERTGEISNVLHFVWNENQEEINNRYRPQVLTAEPEAPTETLPAKKTTTPKAHKKQKRKRRSKYGVKKKRKVVERKTKNIINITEPTPKQRNNTETISADILIPDTTTFPLFNLVIEENPP